MKNIDTTEQIDHLQNEPPEGWKWTADGLVPIGPVTFIKWPRDGHRLICAKNHPMPKKQLPGQLWCHPDANSVDDNDPYYDRYLCPHCGERFKVEVPE